ncbi:NAD(P)-dependent dehydrogenase (short-subunit alcohol dehydrogenase family) [Mucilaginibacter gracilis]|uniref:NAD(P)-dependent dehydrogenase (Short-subunit alcohol dehydrogenase family) n=1 Tax=Mucilaginibacter gracilis TaxID=423350 RepID=A0A495J0F5_9SPHI|nr:SDR family oxidoreductase [Mucilaginibacter gracilis]RKR81784.1 NAD(P)-dependent dehydrogenase (short-subunit alcohol dehydrogenase family) [Mucilaginibacter gracilis]
MGEFNLKDKVIIVTGGTGILGKAFIKGIVTAGGIVGVLGRNEAIANERVREVEALGGKAIALIADVLNEQEVIEAKNKVMDTFGRVDGLINGAGGNMPGGILQPDEDIFGLNMSGMRQVMDLNLWGTLIPTQVFGKAIAETGGGSIVNISSMAAQRAITKVLGYTMAKAAVDAYTKWFAVEAAARYQDKIRINAIAPGFFLTEQNRALLTEPDGSYTTRGNQVIKQTPFKRFGEPDELIGALVWLLGDTSRFVTGTVVNVDGGFSVFSGV